MLWLIAYDISDPRRLQRVAKHLEQYGLRVQYSVFEADLSAPKRLTLERELTKIIDPEVDSIKFFPICGRCHSAVEVIGLGRPPVITDPNFVVF